MQDRASQLQVVQRMIDAGESEENIATVIQHFKQLEPSHEQPQQSRSYGGYRGPTGHATSVPTDVALSRIRSAAPALGGMAAAAMTGGASIPVQILAAGAGGAIGQAVKDAPEEMPASDRFSNMALSGLGQMASQGIGSAVSAVAPRMQSAARSLWNRGAKVTEPVAKTTQTMRMGGSLDQAKQEIAETVLSHGAGTLKASNVEKLSQEMRQIDDAIDEIVSKSPGLVSRHEIRQALSRFKSGIKPGSQEAEAARAAVDKSLKTLNKAPAQMTVKYAHDLKRQIYDTYERTYAADVAQTMTASAEKATGRALRSGIAREEPDVRPLDEQLSKLIPAKKAMDKAVGRGANHSMVGLSQNLAGVVTNPATVAAALINHPKIASFTAQQLYNAAKRLPKNAQTASNIIRLASAMVPAASHRQDD